MRYVVMFSGGIGSYMSARRIVDEHGSDSVTLLFTDVLGEDEDTYRFIDDAVTDLGCEYVRLADGRTIWDVFKDRRYLGNSRLANCSHELKQKPAAAWLEANAEPSNTTVVIGIDWTEMHRIPAVKRAYDPYTVLFPMCEPPYMDKQSMITYAAKRGIAPQRLYEMGMPHANCGGLCVRAGQGQFRKVLEVMPERFAEWERREQEIRQYLNKDVTILTETVNGEKRNLSLTELKQRSSDQIDLFDIGSCGCFVQTETQDDERQA